MFELETLLKVLNKSMPPIETYLVFALGFFLTLITVRYLKVFIYKFLPNNYEFYFLFSCVQCTGFWITLLLLLALYFGFGVLLEINLFLYVMSLLSLVYALITSPLFKHLQLNFWFIKNNSVLPKFIILVAYLLFTKNVIILEHNFIFSFLVFPLAFSLLYVILLNFFRIIKDKKINGKVYRI